MKKEKERIWEKRTEKMLTIFTKKIVKGDSTSIFMGGPAPAQEYGLFQSVFCRFFFSISVVLQSIYGVTVRSNRAGTVTGGPF